jgi:hypothetical protein
VNAKNSIDLTYVVRAERHGAEVRPQHEVTRSSATARTDGA